jgi:hypothetical protein
MSAKSLLFDPYNSIFLSYYIRTIVTYLSAKTIAKFIVQNYYIIDKFLHDLKLTLEC